MHACMSYAAYVAAKVFRQSLEDQGYDDEMMIAIKFLYKMLQCFSRSGQNAKFFLAQLDLDLEETQVEYNGRLVTVKSHLWDDAVRFSMLKVPEYDADVTQDLPGGGDAGRLPAADRTQLSKRLYDPLSILMTRQDSRSSSGDSPSGHLGGKSDSLDIVHITNHCSDITDAS